MKITLKVRPRARRTRLTHDGREYKLEVTAPPVDGKANDAVVDFFARNLGLPRSAVRIAGGAHSRLKVVEIAGAEEPDLAQLIHG